MCSRGEIKRLTWTIAMAIIGLVLGYHGAGIDSKGHLVVREIVIATSWGACIGFGVGSIVSKPRYGKPYVAYWIATLALVAGLFAPFIPFENFILQVLAASGIGAFVGAVVGVASVRHGSVQV
jgi:hypothetical protein